MKDSGGPTLQARSEVIDKALAFPSPPPCVGEAPGESQPRERERTEVASCGRGESFLFLICDVESAGDPVFIIPRPSKMRKRRMIYIAVV